MDGYGELQIAILRQAVIDYQNALKTRNPHARCYLEKWFLSEWGEALSNNNGAYIIEECRRRANRKDCKNE